MVRIIKSAAEFEEVIKGAKPVVVDFTATWCGPCQMIAPFFEEKSKEFTEIEFVKVDVDECDDVAASCGVSAMPTFMAYKEGKKVAEIVGANKAKLEDMIKSL